MVASPSRQHLILPVAPLAAAAVGLLTAAVFALLPTGALESLVVDSGIAAVFSVAEPPLGFTARAVLVLLCGGGVALVAWFALFLVLGTRSIVLQRGGGGEAAPVLRRADAHPDAPPRRPLFANRDLGTPFLEVRARPVHVVADVPPVPEARPIPDDLDQPIASYDPAAMPDEPADWFPPPARLVSAPRRPTFEPGERLETFPLTPKARSTPEPAVDTPRADTSATIQALLNRLERSVPRRAPEPLPEPLPPRETLEDTLSTLRRMATREA